MSPIRTLSSRTVYENPWLRLREDEIEWEGGRPGVHAVLEKEHAAVVVPWDGERLTLVGQVKYPTQRFAWEFPQGALDDVQDAAPELTARTELEEETGLRAATLRHLGRLHYAPGVSSQHADVFLATELEQGAARPEATEAGIRSRTATPAEFDALVLAGDITDAATVAALHLVKINGVTL